MLEGLDLKLPDSTPPKIITCVIEGALEVEDLSNLVNKGTQESVQSVGLQKFEGNDLKALRERHHMAARLLASGLQQSIVCTLTGYSQSYLSTMKKAPSMQELIGFYSARYENAAEAIQERLKHAGLSAVEKLMERIDTEGDAGLSNSDLLGLAKLGLDRAGHGPSSTRQVSNEEHIIDHAELRKLELAAKKGSKDYIEAVPVALPAPEGSNESD